MKTFKEHLLSETNTIEHLEKHVNSISDKLKLQGPIRIDKNNKRLVYTTTLNQQDVFDVLVKAGYRKGSGYDPKPKTWTTSTNHDSMITRSDRIFYGKSGSLFMASIEAEHGSKLRVIFTTQ
jgi:hypothetical protein